MCVCVYSTLGTYEASIFDFEYEVRVPFKDKEMTYFILSNEVKLECICLA